MDSVPLTAAFDVDFQLIELRGWGACAIVAAEIVVIVGAIVIVVIVVIMPLVVAGNHFLLRFHKINNLRHAVQKLVEILLIEKDFMFLIRHTTIAV